MDLINRETVKNILSYYFSKHYYDYYEAIEEDINELPSIVPKEDAVSREDVIKLVECSGYDLQFRTDNADMCNDVKKLPSVTPICEEREKGECPWYER